MVPIVCLACEGREFHWHKSVDFNAAFTHALKELISNVPTAYVVVYESYLYALLCLVYKCVGYKVAYSVVGNDEGFNVYMVLGFTDSV